MITERAQSFNEVACAVINACREAEGQPELSIGEMQSERLIDYAPFPEVLQGKYQSFTQADVERLRDTGYDAPFLSVEDGVGRYCQALMVDGK